MGIDLLHVPVCVFNLLCQDIVSLQLLSAAILDFGYIMIPNTQINIKKMESTSPKHRNRPTACPSVCPLIKMILTP